MIGGEREVLTSTSSQLCKCLTLRRCRLCIICLGTLDSSSHPLGIISLDPQSLLPVDTSHHSLQIHKSLIKSKMVTKNVNCREMAVVA